MSDTRIPTLDTPDSVVDAARRHRDHVLERHTLGQTSDRPNAQRRASALGLLIADTKVELLANVAAHKPAWTEALAARVEATTGDYTAAINRLDRARRDIAHAGSVLAWLDRHHDVVDRRILVAYLGPPAIRFDHDGPLDWSTIVDRFLADTGQPAGTKTLGTSVEPIDRFQPRSLTNVTAVLPTLDMPDPLVDPYRHHRQLIADHRALTIERDRLETTRAKAEAADRRALADSIRDQTEDPGDPNVTSLDTALDDLDTRRAALAGQIMDTHTELRQLIDRHHDGWRSTVQHRYDTAVEAYAAGITEVTITRADSHLARQAAAWLDATTPADLGPWRPKEQPHLAGESWDVMARLLRRDLADHRPAAVSVSGDAA